MTLTAPAPMTWTLDDYHRLIDTGLIAGRRVQLIGGQLTQMPPMNTPHIRAVHFLFHALTRQLGERVFSQMPIIIQPQVGPASEPEPDVYVANPDAPAKPSVAQVALIIEVADSSVARDRQRKVDLYVSAGAREVWLVDLPGQVIEVQAHGPVLTLARGHRHQLQMEGSDAVDIDVDAVFAAAERP